MNRQALDELKRQIPLMSYLQAHDWHPARSLSRGRWMGLCPLHGDHKPSFLVDPNQDLFYCYGCGRGGDVIRFAELYHQVKFGQALALLRQWRGGEPVLHEAARFYAIQLDRHPEAVAYLLERGIRSPELIEHMRIGYAPGGCLRGWLTQLGYPLEALCQAGLVTGAGHDAYVRRIVFPLESNLYGRSLSASAPPHRFLPGAKGGLYAWEQVRRYPEAILVEGLFDYAVLWQAGFHNVTCSLGIHLNARQIRQLCDGPRTVYPAFDADTNGSGQKAAQSLACRLTQQGVKGAHRIAARWPRSKQLLCQWRPCARVSPPVGGGLPVRFRVTHQCGLSNAHSPFRVVAQTGREVDWVNRYLDQERVRGVAESTLRSYAHDLLHFLRWWVAAHKTSAITQQALTESTFLDYIRFQVDQDSPPAAQSVNRRVGTAERAMRREFPDAPRLFAPGFQHWYWRQSRLGYGRPRPALTQLRVKTPKRLIEPLSVDDVARFWSSFRTSRDLAIVGLMLLHGLRSCEVLALNREDVQFPDSQIRVPGKGKKIRMLPLDPDSVKLLDHYLCLERPPHCGQALFVCLKGPSRGTRMTPAGLRSLFRHHRKNTGVIKANPHRFRHTFAADMLRAGISLPALMQLMGHAQIQTTMIYLQLTPHDVWQQYARAVAQLTRYTPPTQS